MTLPTIDYKAALRLAAGESVVVGPVSDHWRASRDLRGATDLEISPVLLQDPKTGEGQRMLLITRRET